MKPSRSLIAEKLIKRSERTTRVREQLWAASLAFLFVAAFPELFDAERSPALLAGLILLLLSFPLRFLAWRWKEEAEGLPEDLSDTKYA